MTATVRKWGGHGTLTCTQQFSWFPFCQRAPSSAPSLWERKRNQTCVCWLSYVVTVSLSSQGLQAAWASFFLLGCFWKFLVVCIILKVSSLIAVGIKLAQLPQVCKLIVVSRLRGFMSPLRIWGPPELCYHCTRQMASKNTAWQGGKSKPSI